MNARLTIFLGDVSEDVAISAKSSDTSAWLLHRDNFAQFRLRPNDIDTTIYTSLGDLPDDLTIVLDVLKQADTIFYVPPKTWSDKKTLDIMDPTNSIQGLTETLLLLLPDTVDIIGLRPLTPCQIDPIPLVDDRKTCDKQIWVAGCSITKGDGVENHERYGALLAEHLQRPCSFLARSAASIGWAADQILRSDVRSGDLVIFGLTSWPRFTYVHEHKLLKGITPSCFALYPEIEKIVDKKTLWSQQTFYQNFYSIQQVINYCKKINAELLLVNMYDDNYSLLSYLKSQPNFVQIHYDKTYHKNQMRSCFIDLGSDHSHPGPKQHLAYSNTIINFIQKNKSDI